MSLQIEKIEKELVAILRDGKFKYEIEKFNSGASMIDLEIENRFYCLQLTKNYMGISEITEEDPGFSTVPNESFIVINEFKERIGAILGIEWK